MDAKDNAELAVMDNLVTDPDAVCDPDTVQEIGYEVLAAFGSGKTRPQQVAAVMAAIEKRLDGWIRAQEDRDADEALRVAYDRRWGNLRSEYA